jgi:hypothetical protein
MKYVDDSKQARDSRMESWLTARWTRTYKRTCPITGREVTLEDVERGLYALPRINGDSAYGYEVFPTNEHLMDLLTEIVSTVRWEPKYMLDAYRLVNQARAELAEFHSKLEAEGVKVIADENGLVTEYNNL